MGKFIEVARVGELTEGAMKAVNAAGRDILLVRVGDKYYAVSNRCPHMGGILSQGKLESTIVTCPRHGSQFDLTDGHVIRWTNWSGLVLAAAKLIRSPHSLPTFNVKIDGEKILVEV